MLEVDRQIFLSLARRSEFLTHGLSLYPRILRFTRDGRAGLRPPSEVRMGVFRISLRPARTGVPKTHPSLRGGVRSSSSLPGPGSEIQPVVTAAAMMMGGWVSWEMVHFISEVALTREE